MTPTCRPLQARATVTSRAKVTSRATVTSRASVNAASAVVMAAVLLISAACAGGPVPRDWAGQVCQALAPWRTEIEALNAQASTQMTTAESSTEAKGALVQLVGGAEAASEAARVAVKAAGIPDADGGDQVAQGIADSLSGTRDAYAKARQELLAMDTADESAFYDGVVRVMAQLDADYRASAVDTGTLSSAELRQAFDGLESCR